MKRKSLRKFSIKKRLALSICIILIIQVALLALGIFGGSIGKKLKDEYLIIFDEKVLARKNYLQETIERYYRSLLEYENFIQEKLSEISIEDGGIDNNFLEEISERAVLGLRQSNATGIYVIFNKGGRKEGFYIRDLEPSVNPPDNSDLLFLRGPVSVARKIKLSLDREWSSEFKFKREEERADVYYKPLNAAIKNRGTSFKDLGYWNKPQKIGPHDVEVITYSIPLIDEEGNPYGVIGIDLTLDYLYSLLPYDELGHNKKGAYMLGLRDREVDNHRKILSAGPIFNRILDFESEINFTRVNNDREIYKTDSDVYFSTYNINLYNNNSPFIDEEWYLAGIMEEDKLFSPIYHLMRSILFILLISLILVMVGIFIVGNSFINPITKLVKQLLASDPNKRIILNKTNIKELDELSKAIEIMSNKVADSSSKLSQVVDMINIPIGAFEYVYGEDKIYITDRIFSILEIDKDQIKSNYIPIERFNNIIDRIKKHPESDGKNIYLQRNPQGKLSWLRVQSQEEEGKILGIIEDVTEEMIAKRKIEYERDLDLLTQLLNRRAFNARVRKTMEEGEIDIAAIVMWDLDNLKYINDTYGHDYGDQYIKLAADVLREFTVYNSIVARMSGDEFYVFIYGYKNKEEIKKIINNIQRKINSTYLIIHGKRKLRVRASAGVAWYPEDSSNFEELLKYSDFAMYQIKNSNKGNVGEFDKKIYKKDSILLYGKEELNNFIDNELVKFVFQPIVDAKTGEVFAYEALMRPQMELLKSPMDLIRLAQSQSKLNDIEKIVWFNAMAAFVDKIELFNNAKIFINSIPNYALSGQDLELFEERFEKYLDRIVIEITESEQSNELCTQIKKDAIARWGAELALDDFGSGYNSEISLLLLSPKYIKVDMGIIRDIDKDENRQKLLRNILSYTKNRDIEVIAEGVETKKELETLIGYGVDYLQGYYLGKPKSNPVNALRDQGL